MAGISSGKQLLIIKKLGAIQYKSLMGNAAAMKK